jgi:membrane-associated phospholipid phosphatase
MIASTPIIGAHYLVDVIAGIVLAAASIAFAKQLSNYLEQAGYEGCATYG